MHNLREIHKEHWSNANKTLSRLAMVFFSLSQISSSLITRTKQTLRNSFDTRYSEKVETQLPVLLQSKLHILINMKKIHINIQVKGVDRYYYHNLVNFSRLSMAPSAFL